MRDRLRAAGIEGPERDARLLAETSFSLRGIDLITHENRAADPEALGRLEALTTRRLAGEPIARILGEKEFYGLSFKLTYDTLVPRPETEMLVDFGLEVLDPEAPARILDLGTGTGCVAIALLKRLPAARAVAVDASQGALKAARENAARHGVDERFEARHGSWLAPVGREERFALIVSNPPYIESPAIAGLAREVRLFDPRLALDGGADGLEAYRAILAEAPGRLQPGGWLALEIGAGQGRAVAALADAAGLERVTVKKDLAGLDRMVSAHHV